MRSTRRLLWAATAALGAALLSARLLSAQPFPKGQLIEGVAVEAAPEFTYSLYLPTAYSDEREWPLLFVMDPRGRGAAAAGIFVDGAERFGYILASSDNTRSDGDLLPNEQAINATLPELARKFPIREGDLYLAGMSGTSRVAWMAGHLMRGAVAGVIGAAGATAGGDLQPGSDTKFAYFGIAANRDFNYREMLQVHADLDSAGVPNRLAYVDGRHSWPPEEVAAQALGWMRLTAFREGRKEMPPDLIDRLLASVRGLAADHEAAGRELDALLTYSGIVEDFSSLRPTAADEAAVRRLEDSPVVERQRGERRRWARKESGYPGRIGDATARLRSLSPPPGSEQILDQLDVERLLDAARKRPRSEEGLAAVRMLSTLFSQMSFYVFRQLHQSEEWLRAGTALEVAHALAPEDASVLYNLACVRARGGQKRRALEALEGAVAAGYDDRRSMDTDPDLKGLRQRAEYRRIADLIDSGDESGGAGEPGS